MSFSDTPAQTFELHERLAADTKAVAELALCRCLLMEDARFPWLILVPRLPDLREFHEVPADLQPLLLQDIQAASIALQAHCQAHKLNVAALGNQVPQLHIHIIARQTDDPAWPGPVWGVGTPEPYDDASRTALIDALRQAFTAAV